MSLSNYLMSGSCTSNQSDQGLTELCDLGGGLLLLDLGARLRLEVLQDGVQHREPAPAPS